MSIYTERVADWPKRMRRKVGETRDGRKLYEPFAGVMVIYDPDPNRPESSYNRPWCRSPFDGCFGDRTDSPSKCSWVPPGCWPNWML